MMPHNKFKEEDVSIFFVEELSKRLNLKQSKKRYREESRATGLSFRTDTYHDFEIVIHDDMERIDVVLVGSLCGWFGPFHVHTFAVENNNILGTAEQVIQFIIKEIEEDINCQKESQGKSGEQNNLTENKRGKHKNSEQSTTGKVQKKFRQNRNYLIRFYGENVFRTFELLYFSLIKEFAPKRYADKTS